MKYIRLNWRDQNPLSEEYDDIYYSTEDGFSETTHVFINGNSLINRWKNLTSSFSIAETGFGTGLNFLTTWYYWSQYLSKNSDTNPWLHYVSIEKCPVHPEDIKKSYSKWDHLISFGNELLKKYPPAVPGFHYLKFPEFRLSLTLIWDDAHLALQNLKSKFNAWYLDGFNPNKNPELWNQEIIDLISFKTHSQGTLSTFTVARDIKNHLTKSGFSIEKKPGFGKKREMLTAKLNQEKTEEDKKPWFSYNQLNFSKEKKAIIIGSGLAGCHTTYALSQRNWEISLIDQENRIASHGSGNDIGILFPYLSSEWDYKTQFYLQSYLYQLSFLNDFDPDQKFHQSCGMIWLPRKARDLVRFKKIKENLSLPENILTDFNKENSQNLCHTQLNQDGLYFPQGTWVKPKKLCQKLLDSTKSLKLFLNKKVEKVSYKNNQWLVFDQNSNLIDQAPTLILCQGFDNNLLFDYPFMKVRGQISSTPKINQLKSLSKLLCYGGYTTPLIDHHHHMGATFQINEKTNQILEDDHFQNIETLNYYLENKFDMNQIQNLSGRVSFRNVTYDRFPVIGSVPSRDFFEDHYHDLHLGQFWKNYPLAEYASGLYINSSHGSRGILSSCLGSELLAQLINKEPLSSSHHIIEKLHPARFMINEFKKNPKNKE